MNNIISIFEKIQDKRQNKGKRYRLSSILALILIGYMQGHTSLAKIHRFSKTIKLKQLKKLGFNKTVPSHPTLTETIKRVSPKEFEQALRKITLSDGNFKQIAIDGKSIRSTYNNAKGLLHMVSAYAVETCGVISQRKSGLAGGEIKAAKHIIGQLKINGKLITGDALFAQKSLCKQIVNANGDYLFKVKRNRKRVYDDIYQTFNYYNAMQLPIKYFDSGADKKHGRIEQRMIEVIALEPGYNIYFDHVGIKQIARIHKTRYNVKTKKESSEITYIITSMDGNKAQPEQLLNFMVNHWQIENKLHRTRDTTFKEDTCNIGSNTSQQNNSSLRNLAIFLLNKINSSITHAIESVIHDIRLAFALITRRI